MVLEPQVMEVVIGLAEPCPATLLLQGAQRVQSGMSSQPAAELATDAARKTQSGIPRQVVFLPTCVNRCNC